MIRTCFVLVLAAACGSKPAPVASKTPPPSFRPAAHYAALFQPGASWTYAVTSTKGHDAKDWKTTCAVANVREVAGGIASDISCDLGPLSGTWVADKRGLWKLFSSTELVLDDQHAELVIAADPRPSVSVVKRGGDWCASHDGPEGGPGTHEELCFGVKGVVGGESTFSPGAEQDFEREAFSL